MAELPHLKHERRPFAKAHILLGTWAFVSIFVAVLGPLGTFDTFSFLERLGYWSVVIGVTLATGLWFRAFFTKLNGSDSFRVDVFGSVAQSLTLGPAIWLFNLNVLPNGQTIAGWRWLVFHVAIVGLVCCGVVAFRLYMRSKEAQNDMPPKPFGSTADLMPSVAPRFVDRLDPPIGGNILRVSADGHYLQVITTKGQSRVRMRFQDSIAELPNEAGYRIHRSHWVAKSQILRVRREGRRHIADLSCGEQLPVSQAYLHTLEDAGLIR